jgi:hypothetical protein
MYSHFQYVNNMKTIVYFTGILSLLFLFACSDKAKEQALNKDASLPDALLDKVSGLHVINSSINNKKHTTSLLYGNQNAIERITNNQSDLKKGEKLVCITWQQKSDPNWIGAIIPGKLHSFEILEWLPEKQNFSYQKFEGNTMSLTSDTLGNSLRIKIILGQKMAILP